MESNVIYISNKMKSVFDIKVNTNTKNKIISSITIVSMNTNTAHNFVVLNRKRDYKSRRKKKHVGTITWKNRKQGETSNEHM